MSYNEDLTNAGKWWVDIQGKSDTDDVPDPVTPHLFENAVTEMDNYPNARGVTKQRGF